MTTPTTTLPVFQTPPDLFARSWANLSGVARLADQPVWHVERHEGRGVWLVTAGGDATLASWVPDEPGMIDQMPALTSEPDLVFAFGDPDKRIDSLCKFLSSHWSKSAAPGFDEYLQVRPGQRLSGPVQTSLTQDGGVFEPSSVAIWSSGEWHNAPSVNDPAPPWRSVLRTFEAAPRQHIKLDPEVLKALSGAKGMQDAKLTFGTGGLARVDIAPVLGDYCHITGFILVGTREESKPTTTTEAATDLRLISQAFDGSKGWVDDIEGGEIDG